MNCERYREWIEEAALGALDASRRAQLDGHLAACSRCRDAFEAARSLFAAIDQGVAVSVEGKPSPQFAAQVRMRLADEGERAGFRPWWRPAAWIPIMAGAALALLLLTVWFVHRSSHTHGPETARVVSRPAAPKPAPSSEQATLTAPRTLSAPPRPFRPAGPSRPEFKRAGRPAAQEPQLQVLVQPGQWAAVTNLYRAGLAGRLNGAKEKPASAEEPLQVKPVEVAPLAIAEIQDPKPVGTDER